MSRYYWIALAVLTCCLLEVSSRPSNNESTTPQKVEVLAQADATDVNQANVQDKSNAQKFTTNNVFIAKEQETNKYNLQSTTDIIYSQDDSPKQATEDDISEKEYRSLAYAENDVQEDNTQQILDKIKLINNGLKKKPLKQQVNHNSQPHTGGGYVIDRETLEKLQEIIASGKLHPYSTNKKQQDTNSLTNEYINERNLNPRALPFGQLPETLHGTQGAIAYTPFPYLTNIPVLVMPSMIDTYGMLPTNNEIISKDPNISFQTRQKPPSLPFNLQWPLAPFFPILIKDPLVGFMHGGGWNNFVEYGQNADVCNRKQKSVESLNTSEDEIGSDADNDIDILLNPIQTRESRAMKKRTILSSPTSQEIESKKSKKIFSVKPNTTQKPIKQSFTEQNQDTKSTSDPNDGDLRFQFGEFGLFGNKKPVAPSPGFFINRLKVRRGGVAIAGPGGVATAGRGGTAIVGPGGLAYTQPGGLAVAGPAARVVALSSDADLSSIVSRLQEQSSNNGSVPRLLEAIPEGKVVATGPVIYYHPKEQ